jgi:hypothetical protein
MSSQEPTRCEFGQCTGHGEYTVMLWSYCLSHAADELVEECGCPWLPEAARLDIATQNLESSGSYNQHIIDMTRSDFLEHHNDNPQHFSAWVARRMNANANKRRNWL